MTPRILWLALMGSQGVYLAIVAIPGVIDRPTTPGDPTILVVLGGMAMLNLVMSFVLPAFFGNAAARQLRPALTDVPTAPVSASYRAPTGSSRGFADREAALRDAVRVGMTPFIIGLALTESIATFGLVVAFMGHPWLYYLPFFAVAALLMLARFPTEHTFLGPVERAHGIVS